MKTYISRDLGGHRLIMQSVYSYSDDRSNLLILTDDRSDGLVHVYYGHDRAAADGAVSRALGTDTQCLLIQEEIAGYFNQFFRS
jgi:hypothetical protein